LKNKFIYKVAVIGAGYIGSVLSGILACKGCKVYAIDINQKIVDSLNKGESPINEKGLNELINEAVSDGSLVASNEFSLVKECDVVLITVGTPLMEDGKANEDAINQVISNLEPYLKDHQLIILKSTVPPFTTDKLATHIRKFADVYVAFCPERLAEGNAIKECLNIPIVVGGINEESSYHAEKFWRETIGVDVIQMNNARSAELVKLADNAWIDLNIAIAFELAKLADKLGIDILPVIQAANSLPKGASNVNILLPSVGVGGYCLTKDPWFLNAFAESFGSNFKTAITSREVNEESPIYAANKLDKVIKKELNISNSCDIEIGILGLSFKNNTGDCRFTPTIKFIENLSSKNYKLKIYDPYIKKEDYQLFNFKNVKVVNSVEEVMSNSAVLAFLTGHKQFQKIKLSNLKKYLIKGAIVFDGRIYFSNEDIKMIKDSGFIYQGIGR
tara:strand:- start:1336 stop:2673 length:1338 start_codon:yes stop_codon:yes gene_type:complete